MMDYAWFGCGDEATKPNFSMVSIVLKCVVQWSCGKFEKGEALALLNGFR
jgi:hypothetical protein